METLFTIIAVCVLFLATALAGMHMWIARAFGWTSLARAYRISGSFQGMVWRLKQCRMVRMGWAGFERSLNLYFPCLPRDVPDEVFASATHELDVGANPEGLYLALKSGVKAGHPPLFIPWSDIAVSSERIQWIDHFTPYWRFASIGHEARLKDGWIDCLVFRFRQAPGVLLEVGEEEARPIIAAAPGSWPGMIQSQSIPSAS